MDDLTKNAREELVGRIGDQPVLEAFEVSVAGMSELGRFRLSPNILGQKKSLHFKTGNVSYYAFIANRSWLLWYFRRPGVTDGVFDFDELKQIFPSLVLSVRNDLAKTEACLRIGTAQEAQDVLDFVRSRVSRIAA